MKKLIFIHLTDFHFGGHTSSSTTSFEDLFLSTSKLISDWIIKKYHFNDFELVFGLGGDMTNKAESLKYQYALRFLNDLKEKLKEYVTHYIFCPGNHDIEFNPHNRFSSFNNFTRIFLNSSKYTFNKDQSIILDEINNFSFISINSLYQEDYRYGSIDLEKLKEFLNLAKHPIIILTHHHLIPIYDNDISTTRNSYSFIKLLSDYNVKYVLSGHLHCNTELSIDKTHILGTSALFPELGSGYNNQFRVLELSSDIKESNNKLCRIILDDSGSNQKGVIES
jgi:3',5'-cyclic AMP phosphodiesterase CpdA